MILLESSLEAESSAHAPPEGGTPTKTTRSRPILLRMILLESRLQAESSAHAPPEGGTPTQTSRSRPILFRVILLEGSLQAESSAHLAPGPLVDRFSRRSRTTCRRRRQPGASVSEAFRRPPGEGLGVVPAPLGPRARIGFVSILSSPGSTPKSAEIPLFLCVFAMPACSLNLGSLVIFAPVPGPDVPQSSVAAAAAMVPVASSKVSTSVRPVRPAPLSDCAADSEGLGVPGRRPSRRSRSLPQGHPPASQDSRRKSRYSTSPAPRLPARDQELEN